MKENPSPIVGTWSEEEYNVAASVCDSEPIANIFLFAEKVYGKDRFASILTPHDELVFAAMLKRKITESEAIAFIDAEMNKELSDFLNEDLSLRFKYNLMIEGKSK